MSDPLYELAKANVELGNRPAADEVPPPIRPVVRRATMTASEYAAQQLAQTVASRPIVVMNRPAAKPKSIFGAAMLATFGVAVAVLIIGWAAFVLAGPDQVTLAEFESIRDGASVEQVNHVVGETGELTSSAGRMQTFIWRNRSGSAMSATFVDGRLAAKAQQGLK